MSIQKCYVEDANTSPSVIRQLLKVLEGFGENEEARCQFAAALLLRLWQEVGANSPGHPPSFLLVGDSPERSLLHPILAATASIPTTKVDWRTNEYNKLRMSVRCAEAAAKGPLDQYYITDRDIAVFHTVAADRMEERLYVDDYVYRIPHPSFGYLAREDGHRTLLVRSERDLKLLRRDLAGSLLPFLRPIGFTADGSWDPRYCHVAGEVSRASWDEELVEQVVSKGFPVLFLPYGRLDVNPLDVTGTTDHPVAKGGWAWLVETFVEWELRKRSMFIPRREQHCYSSDEFLYLDHVRTRLQHMPTAYHIAVWDAMLLLKSIILPVFDWMRHSKVRAIPMAVVQGEYLRSAMAGIVLGIDSLGYFCIGNVPWEQREELMKLVRYIRERPTCSRRDLSRRFQRISTGRRDELLEQLVSLRLVEVDGHEVKAVSKDAYMDSLVMAPGYPRLPAVTPWPSKLPVKKKGRAKKQPIAQKPPITPPPPTTDGDYSMEEYTIGTPVHSCHEISPNFAQTIQDSIDKLTALAGADNH